VCVLGGVVSCGALIQLGGMPQDKEVCCMSDTIMRHIAVCWACHSQPLQPDDGIWPANRAPGTWPANKSGLAGGGHEVGLSVGGLRMNVNSPRVMRA